MKSTEVILAALVLSFDNGLHCTKLEQDYFKLALRDCYFYNSSVVVKDVSSLASCGLECSMDEACSAFIRQGNEYGLLPTCPKCCRPSNREGESWDVYCKLGS